MNYFSSFNIAHEAFLTDMQVQELTAAVLVEYPHDSMMAELHLLRVCMAIRDGRLSLEQALALAPVS